ncbi:MAG: amino acid ABC transporter permease [Deltaproteobacteria bacterium]|nr:amino acid ABC transporter permease [Deltaproteobacteria bacterium]
MLLKNIINYLAFGLVLAGLVWLIYLAGVKVDYIWRWNSVPQYLAYHPDKGGFLGWAAGPLTLGLLMTLKISVVAVVCAIIIGLFTGLARISRQPALRWLAVGYIELIRGTPLLVQIFIFYFFIGTVLNLSRFTAGTAALAVFAGAYVAEIVRAGIQSISKGQMEAARSLGMNYFQAMRHIVLPQAFRRILPPLAGQFISLIKDSSLVSVIALTDLAKAAREIVTSTFSAFEIWFTVAGLYLVLTFSLSMIIRYLERRYGLVRG